MPFQEPQPTRTLLLRCRAILPQLAAALPSQWPVLPPTRLRVQAPLTPAEPPRKEPPLQQGTITTTAITAIIVRRHSPRDTPPRQWNSQTALRESGGSRATVSLLPM